MLFPFEQVASLASRVEVVLSRDKGQVIGGAWWLPPGDDASTMPVGCVEVSVEGGAEVFYAAPRPDSRVHPEKELKVLHPGTPYFYVFNLEPGIHDVVARVGGAEAKTTVRARAGAVVSISIVFDATHFPENPTPPLCLADWPPAPDAGP